VHGSAGVIGVLAPVSVNGFSVDVLVSQVIGVVVITAWTIVATAVVFGAFKALGQARVTSEHERDGLDVSEHGVETYPEFGKARTSRPTAAPRSSTPLTRSVENSPRRRRRRGRLGDQDGHRGRPSRQARGHQAGARGDQRALAHRHERLGPAAASQKTGQWRGEEFTVDLHQKVKIEVVVADIPADEVAEAISEAAKTGEPGDGKVFILPVEDAPAGPDGRDRPGGGIKSRTDDGATTNRRRIDGEDTADADRGF